jgi:hypothetical protein
VRDINSTAQRKENNAFFYAERELFSFPVIGLRVNRLLTEDPLHSISLLWVSSKADKTERNPTSLHQVVRSWSWTPHRFLLPEVIPLVR